MSDNEEKKRLEKKNNLNNIVSEYPENGRNSMGIVVVSDGLRSIAVSLSMALNYVWRCSFEIIKVTVSCEKIYEPCAHSKTSSLR